MTWTGEAGPEIEVKAIPVLDDCELPLQRLYACERERAAELLFTQPIRGEVLEWTWAGAMREVRQVAAWLKAQNWPPGSRIAILSRNSAWWMMADFAIWMAGHVSVPFFPAASSRALTGLFRHCEPVACFLGAFENPLQLEEDIFDATIWVTFPNATAGSELQDSTRWSEIALSEKPLEGAPRRGAFEVGTIIYTSGTTGHPKGAMHSFQGMSLMGKAIGPALHGATSEPDRILSYLPLAHIAERAIIELNVLFAPLQIFFIASQESFLKDLERSRCTLFFSVPRLFLRFQQKVLEKMPQKKLRRLLAIPGVATVVRKKILKGLGLQHARVVAAGGAATPVELIQWFRKLGVRLIEGYGMTETGITHVPLPGQDRVGYVGNTSAFATTRVANDGEVQIAGPMNMLAYFRSPELTREAFTEDGYFRTGDRGEIDSDGRLRLLGRLKEEFKTAKGKFVVPASIEKLLSLSTLFESVAIFGAGMSLPFALVVLVAEKRRAALNAAERAKVEVEIRADLARTNKSLEPHEHLRFIAVSPEPWTVQNGFLTPTLKVRRAAIEEHFAAQFESWDKLGRKVVWL